MCISAGPARFTDTIVGVWGVEHPTHGYIHVVAYGNNAKNFGHGPNAMMLVLPVADPMTKANAVDTRPDPGFLKVMASMVRPRTRGVTRSAKSFTAKSKVEIFELGTSTIVMSANPVAIYDALELVPDDRRPTIGKELFRFIQKERPNDSVVLRCFAGSFSGQEPMMFWYKPRRADILAAPALDAHTGGAPNLHRHVEVDHTVIFGSDQSFRGSQRFSHELTPVSMRPFMPHFITGAEFHGMRPNGDFVVNRSSLHSGSGMAAVMRGLVP